MSRRYTPGASSGTPPPTPRERTEVTANTTISFTTREREVVQGLAEGRYVYEIAHLLRLKENTVKHYITVASRTLGVRGRTVVVDRAYELGLIRQPDREQGTLDLMPRHLEVLPLLAQSLTRVQIGLLTGRSKEQVTRDINGLMAELGARTRPHVVTLARMYGLPTAAHAPSAART
uniref:Putative regulatory protein n=1 Tax=Streptomyces kanamyceticus TaxID=1967 RepID=Q1EQN4_STRKN|nr:putative regulatory protein [Streptomyces kanamyceticus]